MRDDQDRGRLESSRAKAGIAHRRAGTAGAILKRGVTMFDDTDLSNVQAGDKVIYARHNYNRNGYMLETVEKTTPTQIVVNGKRFNRSNGIERNASDWHKDYIYPATVKNVLDVSSLIEQTVRDDTFRALTQRLASIRWNKIPLEKLEQIAAILDK